MEAMTSDEARDLFGDVIEGSLDPAKKAAFEAALASDPELQDELDAYRMVVRGAAAIGGDAGDQKEGPEASPDLLPGVQSRLRARSRGRFYRDRFAEQAGPRGTLPVLVAILVALLLATGWLAVQSFVQVEGPPSPTTHP